MSVIKRLSAMEVLDSRGRPTVAAYCELASGAKAAASVPSGASTGKAEAHELRDGDAKRYGGLGCRKAVANLNGEIAKAVVDKEFDQPALDRAMLALDGTAEKSRLGANAILATSIVFARAVAAERDVALYQHFNDLMPSPRPAMKLPRMTINLFSGGKHAGGQVDIQDVLIIPASASTIDDGLAMTYAVFQAAAKIGKQKYGARTLVADEGGLAPPFASAEAMLAEAVEAIHAAGLQPGKDVAIGVDVASSHFYNAGRYTLGTESLDSAGMIRKIASWASEFPIVSVEDALAEDDWQNWPALRTALTGKSITLGDDFLCTNPRRIKRAIETKSADALLLKVNQIGSLTEAAEAYQLARSAGWMVTVSARSGETEDNWLADLAVGWAGDQIKIGSITRSERLAKYNRLLEIERETKLAIERWPGK